MSSSRFSFLVISSNLPTESQWAANAAWSSREISPAFSSWGPTSDQYFFAERGNHFGHSGRPIGRCSFAPWLSRSLRKLPSRTFSCAGFGLRPAVIKKGAPFRIPPLPQFCHQKKSRIGSGRTQFCSKVLTPPPGPQLRPRPLGFVFSFQFVTRLANSLQIIVCIGTAFSLRHNVVNSYSRHHTPLAQAWLAQRLIPAHDPLTQLAPSAAISTLSTGASTLIHPTTGQCLMCITIAIARSGSGRASVLPALPGDCSGHQFSCSHASTSPLCLVAQSWYSAATSLITSTISPPCPFRSCAGTSGHLTSRFCWSGDRFPPKGCVEHADNIRLSTHTLIDRLLNLTDDSPINNTLIGPKLTKPSLYRLGNARDIAPDLLCQLLPVLNHSQALGILKPTPSRPATQSNRPKHHTNNQKLHLESHLRSLRYSTALPP